MNDIAWHLIFSPRKFFFILTFVLILIGFDRRIHFRHLIGEFIFDILSDHTEQMAQTGWLGSLAPITSHFHHRCPSTSASPVGMPGGSFGINSIPTFWKFCTSNFLFLLLSMTLPFCPHFLFSTVLLT